MIKSIEFQILSSFVAVMAISAASIFFIAKKDIDNVEKEKNTEKEKLEQEKRKSIDTALNVINLVLIENFDYLLRSKNRLVEKQRKLLKNSIDTISILGVYGLAKVMDSLNDGKALYNNRGDRNDIHFMFVDRKGEILLSLDKRTHNKFISNIKSKVSNASYFSLFNIVDRDSVIYSDKKNGYFYNISEDLVLISFSSLSSIEKEERKKRIEIQDDLKKILNNLNPYNGIGFSFFF